jgi:glycine cleavage system pyridoxal-binding protein P
VSQGRLEALLNFQQVTLDLTGMDIASASLLDEATAAAEAMAMAKRVSKLKNANRFFVAADVHPQTLDVVRTRAETFGFDVIVDDADKVLDHQDVFGVLLQQVGTTGEVHDYGADCRAEIPQSGCQRCRRFYGAGAADGTGQTGRGYRIRLCAALRRADGLRRPARGVLRRER